MSDDETGEAAGGATKRCPFCAEEIQAAAILCKHCHASLGVAPPAAATSAPASPSPLMRGLGCLALVVGIPMALAFWADASCKSSAEERRAKEAAAKGHRPDESARYEILKEFGRGRLPDNLQQIRFMATKPGTCWGESGHTACVWTYKLPANRVGVAKAIVDFDSPRAAVLDFTFGEADDTAK